MTVAHLDPHYVDIVTKRHPYCMDAHETHEKMCMGLNEKQNMTHDIVTTHLHLHLARQHPPQCLMLIHSQGGTRKMLLLNAIAHSLKNDGSHQVG